MNVQSFFPVMLTNSNFRTIFRVKLNQLKELSVLGDLTNECAGFLSQCH